MKLPYNMLESTNFNYLGENYPHLATLGAYAERYSFTDANSCLLKLRTFTEFLVQEIYKKNDFEMYSSDNLIGLLDGAEFKHVVPKPIINQLHTLRIAGNKGVHEATINLPQTQLHMYVRIASDIGKWFLMSCGQIPPGKFTAWKDLDPQSENVESLKKSDKKFEEALEEKNKELQKVLDELEEANNKLKKSEIEKQNRKKLKKNEAATLEFITKANAAVNVLKISEAKTRKLLIDESLMDAGWDIRTDSTATVGIEIEVKHQPTASGIGYIDYVLYDQAGKPLAVVEAKKTSVDVQKGKEQARMYAEGLTKQYNLTVEPIIFYTNGFEIFIWNRGKQEPPRKIYGFYSMDSLEKEFFQISNRKDPLLQTVDVDITNRGYQQRAISNILKTFKKRNRKALVIQATGTGKTRVAVSLTDVMMKTNWVKRVLFLCDRNELVTQAKDAYKEFLKGTPYSILKGKKPEYKSRIFITTYQSLLSKMNSIDVGFFDLIIADESHRSIYNRYGDIFLYFDALNVGLTATPVKFIDRNTYSMFTCDDEKPTAEYLFEEAIKHDPPYLTDFEVVECSTKFLREGIKWSELTEEQKEQLKKEDDILDPEKIAVKGNQIGKKLIVTDTDRFILRNLMDNGIKNTNKTRIGKTIIFAGRNVHAIALVKLFDSMYPELGGNHCKVITSSEPRAESLIKEFKDPESKLDIAVSVDMLDTGIDVPEVVNLVFAKSVKSYTKFWQMIGRGTRLCPDLFGAGYDKQVFRIFDHYENFKFFKESYKEPTTTRPIALLEQLFLERISLMETAIGKQDTATYKLADKLIRSDINDLPIDNVSIRDNWELITQLKAEKDWTTPHIKNKLRKSIAPLMSRRVAIGREMAYEFDLLMVSIQIAKLEESTTLGDLADTLYSIASRLSISLTEVSNKINFIQKAKSKQDIKGTATIADIETLREELRGIIHLVDKGSSTFKIPTLGILKDSDEQSAVIKTASVETFPEFRERVHKALDSLSGESPVIDNIKQGDAVTEEELNQLASKVIAADSSIDIEHLMDYPEAGEDLASALRGIVGMDSKKISSYFADFRANHPELTQAQGLFIEYIEQQIITFGPIKAEKLYKYEVPGAGSFTHTFPNQMPLVSVIREIEKLTA